MTGRIIMPAEVKVCATCSYWDGERIVDPDMNVVVISEDCQGECLAQEKMKPGLHDVRLERSCIWENLEPDVPENLDAGASAPPEEPRGLVA